MEKGLRNTLIVSGILGGFTAFGYVMYRRIMKAIEFEIQPKGVKVLSRNAENIKLQITMGVKNPSDLKVTLSKQEYDVYLNGILVARLRKDEDQVVYANSVSTLILDWDVNYKDILAKLNVASGMGLAEKLKFATNLKSQKMKLISKLSIKYGILPAIPISIDSGEYTLSEWGLMG